MSDNFINTLTSMKMLDSVLYVAACPKSRDTVQDYVKSIRSMYFTIDTHEANGKFRMTITRIS